MTDLGVSTGIVIGLSAVIMAVQDGEGLVLSVRGHDEAGRDTLAGLPFGPFDPDGRRTFELALRAFVTEQTGFDLGYVEQLYTFGDKGRDAPLADVGAGAARVISVGYLALTGEAVDTSAKGGARWSPWRRFFPWEDWRTGRPAAIDEAIAPGPAGPGPILRKGPRRRARLARRALKLFALGRRALERRARPRPL